MTASARPNPHTDEDTSRTEELRNQMVPIATPMIVTSCDVTSADHASNRNCVRFKQVSPHPARMMVLRL